MWTERRWFIDWDYDSDSATALVHERLPGTSIVYGVCEITDVGCESDEDGEPALIREGSDADRLRDVSLVVHAPEMYAKLAETAKTLEQLSGLDKPDAECATWVEGPKSQELWQRLAVIQEQLERFLGHVDNLDLL